MPLEVLALAVVLATAERHSTRLRQHEVFLDDQRSARQMDNYYIGRQSMEGVSGIHNSASSPQLNRYPAIMGEPRAAARATALRKLALHPADTGRPDAATSSAKVHLVDTSLSAGVMSLLEVSASPAMPSPLRKSQSEMPSNPEEHKHARFTTITSADAVKDKRQADAITAKTNHNVQLKVNGTASHKTADNAHDHTMWRLAPSVPPSQTANSDPSEQHEAQTIPREVTLTNGDVAENTRGGHRANAVASITMNVTNNLNTTNSATENQKMVSTQKERQAPPRRIKGPSAPVLGKKTTPSKKTAARPVTAGAATAGATTGGASSAAAVAPMPTKNPVASAKSAPTTKSDRINAGHTVKVSETGGAATAAAFAPMPTNNPVASALSAPTKKANRIDDEHTVKVSRSRAGGKDNGSANRKHTTGHALATNKPAEVIHPPAKHSTAAAKRAATAHEAHTKNPSAPSAMIPSDEATNAHKQTLTQPTSDDSQSKEVASSQNEATVHSMTEPAVPDSETPEDYTTGTPRHLKHRLFLFWGFAVALLLLVVCWWGVMGIALKLKHHRAQREGSGTENAGKGGNGKNSTSNEGRRQSTKGRSHRSSITAEIRPPTKDDLYRLQADDLYRNSQPQHPYTPASKTGASKKSFFVDRKS